MKNNKDPMDRKNMEEKPYFADMDILAMLTNAATFIIASIKTFIVLRFLAIFYISQK